jgi:hypothetical protein
MVTTLSRRAVVGAAGREPCLVEAVDRLTITGLERQVRTPGGGARGGRAPEIRDEELVHPEEAGALAAERDAEHPEDRQVEPLRAREIGDDQLQVIDQPATVEFVRRHGKKARSRGAGGQAWPAARRRCGRAR